MLVVFTAPFIFYAASAWLNLVLFFVQAALSKSTFLLTPPNIFDKIPGLLLVLLATLGLVGYLRWVATIFPRGYASLANRKTGVLLALGLVAAAPLIYALLHLPLNAKTIYVFLAYAVILAMTIEVLLPNPAVKRDAAKARRPLP
ncbi:MAG: hypothetical protein B7Z35_03040 [Hydrogenophilales bacterium 12-61-10]|nr:MAG: hypothetical protein B7Z35_03040 [Hydrogenophilales bacterium 12-61-10]